VAFTWQSEGDHSGDITATFGTGRVFKGEYVQISHDVRTESLDPLWDGGNGQPARTRGTTGMRIPKGIRAREQWPRARESASEDGEYMRCRFTLVSPTAA
jgi:hypothetical protein